MSDANEHIRFTGVIKKTERTAIYAAVYGKIADFDNSDAALRLRPSSAFANGDTFSSVFADLGSGTDGSSSKDPNSMNTAFAGDEHRSLFMQSELRAREMQHDRVGRQK